MKIDTKQIVTMTEANQNFSKAVKVVNKYKKAYIIKNNKPKYVILDIEEYFELSDDDKILLASKRVLDKHIEAFKELAK